MLYGTLFLAVFVGAVWFGFRKAIVGRSVTVPDLTGKTPEEAFRVAVSTPGCRSRSRRSRARNDDKIARGKVLLQQPEAGSLAKPSQVDPGRPVAGTAGAARSGPRRAGAPRPRLSSSRGSPCELGPVSWYRDPAAPPGIVAQDPEPEVAGLRGRSRCAS